MNLRRLDLNLLVVFDALMKERHVTRAARSIGLSQPAFSNALNRLRERLQDDLFVRTPSGMKPTEWALELSGPISGALGEIEVALDGADFHPKRSNRKFTIATLDYATISLFPPLLDKIKEDAPSISLTVIKPSLHPGEYLDHQQADMALLNWSDPPDRYICENIMDEDWVCVISRDNPHFTGEMTLEKYVILEHLSVDPKGDLENWLDGELLKSNMERHVSLVMPTFGPTGGIIERTELVLTCPRSIGNLLVGRYNVGLIKCPVDVPERMRKLNMVWHSRLSNHPAQIWLRDLIREVSAGIS